MRLHRYIWGSLCSVVLLYLWVLEQLNTVVVLDSGWSELKSEFLDQPKGRVATTIRKEYNNSTNNNNGNNDNSAVVQEPQKDYDSRFPPLHSFVSAFLRSQPSGDERSDQSQPPDFPRLMLKEWNRNVHRSVCEHQPSTVVTEHVLEQKPVFFGMENRVHNATIRCYENATLASLRDGPCAAGSDAIYIDETIIRVVAFDLLNPYERFHAYLNVAMVMVLWEAKNPRVLIVLGKRNEKSAPEPGDTQMWKALTGRDPVFVTLGDPASEASALASITQRTTQDKQALYRFRAFIDAPDASKSVFNARARIWDPQTNTSVLSKFSESAFVRALMAWIKQRFVPENHNASSIRGPVRVLWSSRQNYCCRNGKIANVHRVLRDEPDWIDALQEKLGDGYRVRSVDFANATTQESIQLVTESDVVVGVHGAGLVWSAFLDTTSQHNRTKGLCELRGGDRLDPGNTHYQFIADLLGISYRVAGELRGNSFRLRWWEDNVESVANCVRAIQRGASSTEAAADAPIALPINARNKKSHRHLLATKSVATNTSMGAPSRQDYPALNCQEIAGLEIVRTIAKGKKKIVFLVRLPSNGQLGVVKRCNRPQCYEQDLITKEGSTLHGLFQQHGSRALRVYGQCHGKSFSHERFKEKPRAYVSKIQKDFSVGYTAVMELGESLLDNWHYNGSWVNPECFARFYTPADVTDLVGIARRYASYSDGPLLLSGPNGVSDNVYPQQYLRTQSGSIQHADLDMLVPCSDQFSGSQCTYEWALGINCEVISQLTHLPSLDCSDERFDGDPSGPRINTTLAALSCLEAKGTKPPSPPKGTKASKGKHASPSPPKTTKVSEGRHASPSELKTTKVSQGESVKILD